MKGLTKRQAELLSYIEMFIEDHGYAPSFREIAKEFDIQSVSGVHKHIQALEKKGFLEKSKFGARSLHVKGDHGVASDSGQQVPFVGYLSLEEGIETLPNPKTITFPKHFVPEEKSTYALKIKGDGFSDEWLADGDLLLVEGRGFAISGETIIGQLPFTKALIKRYHPLETTVELQSCTKPPQFIDPYKLTIFAIVLGQIRFYS